MMNLKLSEWNEACEYAKESCEGLKSRGHNVEIKPYSMYDGRKGIYFQIFDNMGSFFKEYATGIHTNLVDTKKAVDMIASRIVKDC